MSSPADILLVDDEPRNLTALDAILANPSYRLLHATDADQALSHLINHDVAAVVLDVMMPGTDGFELAKMIRGAKRFRHTPIVFLSANMIEARDVLAGYEVGAVDYLSKPVNPRILQQKIEIFVELFRMRRELAELNKHLEDRVRERTAELERSEALLRAADVQRTTFLATLAHELRNPLAPIRTGLDVLATQGSAPPPQPVVDGMTRQLGHLVRLVDDLLDASRVRRDALRIEKAPMDLVTTIETAIATVRPNAERRRQSLVFERAAPLRTVADEMRVCQIVSNLLHNASKFSPPGEEIHVVLRQEAGTAIVRVSDRGPGIPPAQLGAVFDMFTTIERGSAGPTGGLGIGLALSRKLAELHGGTLTAESGGETRGATFTLTLPIEQPATDAAAIERGRSSRAAQQAGAAPLRVVVIEDNQDAADILAMWLVDAGHRVDVAHTGPAGIDLVRRLQPDLVLCDIGLPGMDGVEVCRRVNRDEHPPPAMVALTGWGTESDRQRTLQAGFDHHLLKPVQPDELRALLATVRARERRVTSDHPLPS
jgi:signal transduction histidine kinase